MQKRALEAHLSSYSTSTSPSKLVVLLPAWEATPGASLLCGRLVEPALHGSAPPRWLSGRFAPKAT